MTATSDSASRSTSPASKTDLPAPLRIVDVPASNTSQVMAIDTWAFPSAATPATIATGVEVLPWERTVGVIDPEVSETDLVAFHSSYPVSLPTPGGVVPASGLTWVGVHPQYRRRGILTAMIARHFADCQRRGEAVSGLFAAETAIYQRFGYAEAATMMSLTVPRGAALWDVQGAQECAVRLELFDWDRHHSLVNRLYGDVGKNRPGWVSRDEDVMLRHATFYPKESRDGFETLRIAIVERAGIDVGYAFFRRRLTWETDGPKGTVAVTEPVVQDAAVARALWGVLLDLDLMVVTDISSIAADDPLVSLLVDSRAARPQLRDNLFVRVIDVPAALTARAYQTDFEVVLSIFDNWIPANNGNWRVQSFEGDVEVTATTDAADLSLDIRALSACYLGGRSLAHLARAGQLEVLNPQALRHASVAFGSDLAPYCAWSF